MSPGVSVVPASALPSITVSPPNSSACTSAPSRLTPPSAMSGTRPSAAARHSTSACTCGTPKFVLSRVVQPPPGPMPTLMPLTPRSSRKRTPSAVATLPAIELDVAELLAERLDRARHDDRVAVRDVDDDDVGAGAEQLGGALEIVALGADRRADAQPALRVARRERQLPLRRSDPSR